MRRLITVALCALMLGLVTPSFGQDQEVAMEVETKSKPKINVGVLMHTMLEMEQNGFGQSASDLEDVDSPKSFSYGANLYRARLLLDAQLTKKDYIFFDTSLTASIGLNGDKSASIKILDAWYQHTFWDSFSVSAGKMVASYNRNGLQSAAMMMANDFATFQYPYNMLESDPLQGDEGRDIGVNFSGNVGKFGYRLGVFSGCRDYTTYTDVETSILRFTGRVNYDFFDKDNYAGTNLGKGRTLSVGVGFDNQGSYYAVGGDLFLDTKAGSLGSITANAAYSYLNGGNIDCDYNFVNAIPNQNIVFAELGYYFKDLKLQPWVKYELQNTVNESVADQMIFGGGVNYFFNGYGSNIKASYLVNKYSNVGDFYGQLWIQLQLFIFK